MSKSIDYTRYNRQVLLPGFGEEAQQKLLEAKVIVIGAGGLGCPVLQYLTAAGVGTIGIVDNDVVSLTNLHRQVLYNMHDIGISKAERAASVLHLLNPGTGIVPYNMMLTNQNALNILSDYDIIIDATDNFSSRYMINDACVLLKKPLVYGAVSRFEGQVAVFNVKQDTGSKAVNYRDLFSIPPKDNEVLNCAEAGVLGVLPGIIGSMQANETIKLITGIGQPLVNRLLTYNALNNQFFELTLNASEDTAYYLPVDEAAFLNADYASACTANSLVEIDTDNFEKFLQAANTTIVDVRESGEMPAITEFMHIHIPLSQIVDRLSSIKGDTIITICQSGGRSLQAAKMLDEAFKNTKKIYSLKGGITSWKQRQLKQ
jgi:molybdopterin/thiamine biosynthesis adenylyltransferase/rhodanese-related sulfurtransferase